MAFTRNRTGWDKHATASDDIELAATPAATPAATAGAAACWCLPCWQGFVVAHPVRLLSGSLLGPSYPPAGHPAAAPGCVATHFGAA